MPDLFDDLLAQTKTANGEQLLHLGQQVSIAHLKDGTLTGEQFRQLNDAWHARMRTLVGPEDGRPVSITVYDQFHPGDKAFLVSHVTRNGRQELARDAKVEVERECVSVTFASVPARERVYVYIDRATPEKGSPDA